MACANCGNPNTIRAHLVPQLFCKQVQEGKSHAAQVTGDGKFQKTQSGIFDKEILCKECDGKLGDLENYAGEIFDGIVQNGSERILKFTVVENADPTKILRFCCGILYKYSLTKSDKDRITLGKYQEACRQVAYGEIEPPEELDALLLRPILFIGDKSQFAYRAPYPARIHGINVFRMMLGGIVIVVKLDQRSLPEKIADVMLRTSGKLIFLTQDAREIEEYQTILKFVAKDQRLYDYLKKVERQK